MAYIVSQIKKGNNLDIYRNQILPRVPSSTVEMITSQSSFSEDQFVDYSVIPTTVQNGERVDTFLQSGEVYFLEYEISKVPEGYYDRGQGSSYYPDVLNIDIVVKNFLSTENNAENIGSIRIPCQARDNQLQDGTHVLKENFNEKVKGTLIFSPSVSCDRIGFKISRNGYDFLVTQRNWLLNTEENISISYIEPNSESEERKEKSVTVPQNKITITNLCSLNNLVSNNGGWLKFGFQSRPGTLIAVNGEPIVVGRSGVYEINNGTKIYKFMIATPGNDINKIDAFLLDYAYETSI